MRIDVGKYLFVGKNQADFFSACRELGVIEFISEKKYVSSEQSQKFVEGLKILERMKHDFASVLPEAKPEGLSVEEVLSELFSLNQEITALFEALKALGKEIVRVKPLGHFSSAENSEFTRRTGLTIRYFYRKHIDGQELEVDQSNVFYLATAYNFDYYVVIGVVNLSKEEYTEIEAPRSMNELQQEEASVRMAIHRKQSRMCELYAYREDIVEGLCECDNAQRLEHAQCCAKPHFDGRIFSVVGWVITDQIESVQELCNRYDILLEKISPDPNEIVPTYLHNEGLGRIGEDLVNIYDTPASSDKDPSLWVFVSFFIFFSMIVNDAGYGLVFLCTSLFLAYKKRRIAKQSKALTRFLKLSTLLGIGCICWGCATTSFFGVSVSYTNPVREYSLTHYLAKKKAAYYLEKTPKGYQELVEDYPILKEQTTPEGFLLARQDEGKVIVYDRFVDNVLLELALFVGMIHLALGMLRYGCQRYSAYGWVLFLIGAYFYLPVYLHSVSLIHYALHLPFAFGGTVGLYIMLAGIICALLGGICQRGWKGLDELTAIIQVFSDALSYLRIYALGLAGAMVGGTIMQMGERFPPLIGALIVVFGHSVNIVLSIMSGVIHGLRLNFIEWYHYSFDGGGRMLRPLVKITYRRTNK